MFRLAKMPFGYSFLMAILNLSLIHIFAAARCNGSENVPQLFMTLSAMGGHYGKPGNCSANNYHANAGNGGPALVKAGSSGLPSLKNPIEGVIPGPQVWDCLLYTSRCV